jgi:hypothetical protein
MAEHQYTEEANALREVAEWVSDLAPAPVIYQAGELAASARDYVALLREFSAALAVSSRRDAARLAAMAAALDRLTVDHTPIRLSPVGAQRMLQVAAYLANLADWLEGRVARVGYDCAQSAATELAALTRRGGHEYV